jgi:hypothetical protein
VQRSSTSSAPCGKRQHPTEADVRRLFLCFVLLTFAQAQFEDIPPEHWAEGAVRRLTELGVITGFPDGRFHGDQGVTRYEVSLMLARLWDGWNTESLSEIWSNLVGLETQVTELQAQREMVDALLTELQGRVDEAERYLVELDSRTADNEETSSAVETLTITLEVLRSDVASMRDALDALDAAQEQLQTLLEAQNTRLEETDARLEETEARVPDVPDYSSAIAAVESKLTDALAALGERVTVADETLTTQVNDLSIAVASLIEQKEAKAWQATLDLEAGFLGGEAAYGLNAAFSSTIVDLNARVSTFGVTLGVSAAVSPSFGLSGRFVSAGGVAGSVGPVVYLSPALSASVAVGTDGGLAFTGVLHHEANKADSFIPGLDVLASVVVGENEEGALERWLFQANARYVLQGDGYFISPGFFYRRSSSEDYQLFMPEIGGGFLLGDTLVSARVRYGIVQQLSGGGRSVPEGDLVVQFGSGAYGKLVVDGGLPDSEMVASFAPGSPLGPVPTKVGVSVGYSFKLDELLK